MSDWSSDVCSSDLPPPRGGLDRRQPVEPDAPALRARQQIEGDHQQRDAIEGGADDGMGGEAEAGQAPAKGQQPERDGGKDRGRARAGGGCEPEEKAAVDSTGLAGEREGDKQERKQQQGDPPLVAEGGPQKTASTRHQRDN